MHWLVEEITTHAPEHVAGTWVHQASALGVVIAFAILPLIVVLWKLLHGSSMKDAVLTIIPEKGDLGQLLVHAASLLVVAPLEIATGSLSALEATVGSGALSTLPSVVIVFQALSKRTEGWQRIVLLYSTVIAMAAMTSVYVSHIWHGEREVGPGLIVINLMLLLGITAFNTQSSGSRGERKQISHDAHFHVEIDRFLSSLDMCQLWDLSDVLRQALVKYHDLVVISPGGLLDQALDALYEEKDASSISLGRDVRRAQFVTGLSHMREGDSHTTERRKHTRHKHVHVPGL